MGADIVERLQSAGHFYAPPHDAILYEAAAEIGRLRGEVEALRQCGIKYLGWLGVKNAEKALREDMADPEMVDRPAPAMPNGVEGLSPAWHCTNCRNTFTATDALWKGHSDRCAPKCPNCKADSQYTYPEGVGGLIDKLEHYGFECQGGTLTNCSEWSELIRALRAADNRDAAGVATIRAEEYTRGRCDGWEAARSTPAAVPAGEAVAFVAVPDDYRNQASGYRAGWTDAMKCTPQPADGEAVASAWKTVHVLMSVMRFRPLTDAEQGELQDAHVTIRTTPPAPVQAAPQEADRD